ncbi:MAG: hypothetical protein J6J60_03045 [Clostridia bacterium]|nr:hypothetical protein [Clostridia bacterium]
MQDDKILKMQEEIRFLKAKVDYLTKENQELKECSRLKVEKDELKKMVMDDCYVCNEPTETENQANAVLYRIYRVLFSNGYRTLWELNNQSISKCLRMYGAGERLVAALVVICEHYGIKLIMDTRYAKKALFETYLEKYKKNLRFKD